jgi:type IV secretion system protein VirB9/ComB9 competence protein
MIKKLISFLMIVCLSVTARADNIDSAQSHKEVSAQAKGDYPSLNRESSVPLASMQKAWEHADYGAGVRIVNFDPRDTVRLVVREYMTTTIVFPQWEQIEDVIVGDEGNYQVLKPKGNILTLRPVNYVGIDTSITIIGESGHVYGFYVRVEGYNSKNISDITVRMQVPEPIYANNKQSKQTNIAQQEKDDYLEEAHFDSSKLDFKFSMSGDESIAPDLVYSDGVRMWFDYGDNLDERNLPTFFSVVDGYQKAINVTLDGGRLVAHGAGSFVLKSGDKVTCVYPTKTKGSRT